MFYYNELIDNQEPVECDEYEADLEFLDEMEPPVWQDDQEATGYQDPLSEYARFDLGKKFMSVVILVVMVGVGLALYTISGKASETSLNTDGVNQNLPTPAAVMLPVEVADLNPQMEKSGDFDCALSERYPTKIRQWCDLIVENANKRGLPPDLVAALIWQESGGNPGAYSRSGAVGLMQVMPRDGLAASFMCANGPCFHNRPKMDELKDPAFNISYGTKMLAGLVNKNGSLREALKSYGPMDVGYYYADKVLGIYQQYGNN